MAFDVGISIGADTSALESGLKSGSKSLSGFGRASVSAAKQVAGLTAAALATAGALTAIVKASAESAKEIQNLSQIAGVGAQEFQRYALAARKYGIEQDKLADIFKDTSDKVGDFLSNGAGPMADFFENIGPKVGVTADQFARLSGPEALQLYVSSLEKANVSQNEMTFYMEALASDATALVPLLRADGEELKRLTENSKALNNTLSDTEINQLLAAGDQFAQMQQNVKVLTDRFAIQLAPILVAISEELGALTENAGGMGDVFQTAFSYGIRGAGVMADGIRGIQVIVQGLITGFHGFSLAVNTVFATVTKATDALINAALESIAQLVDGVNKLPGVDIDFNPAKASAGAFFEGLADTSQQSMTAAATKLHELMMQPLPSESLENWAAQVQETSRQVAAEAVAARNEALKVPELTDDAEQARRDQLVASSDFTLAAKQAEQDQLTSLEAQATAKRISIQQQEAAAKRQVAKGMFDNLSTLMQSGSKELFAIGKAAAIASAILNGYEAAIGSYAQGAKIGGPWLGAAFAATSVVATGAMIAKLASTTQGQKTAGNIAPSSGGSVSVPQQQAAAPAQQETNVNVNLQGETFSRSSVVALIGEINDAVTDGAKLNVGVV